VRDLVTLFGELESAVDVRVVVLESANPEYFVPHVDLTKVAEYTAEAAKAGGPDDASLGMLWHKLSELPVVTIAKLSELPVVTIAKLRGRPVARAANWRWRATCASPPGRTLYWASRKSGSVWSRALVGYSIWGGCWAGAGPWRRFSVRPTSTPSRPNGTAGSTGRYPTPTWTRS
jgi:hypothetical protein